QIPVKVMSACGTECPISSKVGVKQCFRAFAADLLHYNSVFQLANATDSTPTLPLEKGDDGGGGKLMMMRGMTAKDFDPIRYSGRWFEVASLNEDLLGKGEVLPKALTLPFIPKEPYDVIATDYDNFAVVSGAKDKSFVQIYSRTPDPGPKFIEKYKNYLASFGYDPSKIKDTPQDCEVKSTSQLAAMMSMSGMQCSEQPIS
ncbi:hypothetical protein HAX54_028979, partial [Datura stramonium]|nr:hypothetical protein [Datura stramonium]